VIKRLFGPILLTMLMVLLLAACGSPQPADHLELVQQAGVIKVGTSADYPPFEYIGDDGERTGFDIALMSEIGKRLGVKLDWKDIASDDLIEAVQKGKIDLAISAFSYNPNQLDKVAFSTPYYEDRLTGSPLSIVLQKDDMELHAAIDKIIQQLDQEGFIKQLAVQYLTERN
jgi:ABC-type amino acid transport substrate-binding protein